MGAEKAKLKMELAHELGCEFDDTLDKAKEEILRWNGGARSLRECAKAVEGLIGHIAKDLKSEKISPEAADFGSLYIRRAVEVCRNLALKADVMEQRSHGRVDALNVVIKITKQVHTTEEQKLIALESPTEGTRAVGEHPGPHPADDRREANAAEPVPGVENAEQ